ncbi:MAG TPA: hypothetical protein VM103_00525 [Candidatus Paceibacterota bacterium]|nr:hypothetical protein [Candidatus Paceibacterota bacterium]
MIFLLGLTGLFLAVFLVGLPFWFGYTGTSRWKSRQKDKSPVNFFLANLSQSFSILVWFWIFVGNSLMDLVQGNERGWYLLSAAVLTTLVYWSGKWYGNYWRFSSITPHTDHA